VHHGGISNDAQVAAFASDARFAQGHDVVVVRNLFFQAAVEVLVFEEDHRMLSRMALLIRPWASYAVPGRRLQAGRVDEIHSDLGVKRAAVNIAALGPRMTMGAGAPQR